MRIERTRPKRATNPQEAEIAQQESFVFVYENYVGPVFGYFYNWVRNVQEAEDLTASVFESFWSHRQNYQDRGQLAAYLFAIARNKLRNRNRQMARHRTWPNSAMDNFEASSIYSPTSGAWAMNEEDIIDQIETSWLQQAVREAVLSLPKDQQKVIVLKFLFGLTNEEIARQIGRTPGATKSFLHRILRKLKSELTPYQLDRMNNN